MTQNYGPVIFGVTGGLTLANQWFQKGNNSINWAIIPWTALGMIGFALLGALSPAASNGLASITLLTELTVPFHGRRPPLQTVLSALPKEK
jgi:hypothetical protein